MYNLGVILNIEYTYKSRGWTEHWVHLYDTRVIMKQNIEYTCTIKGLYWTLSILVQFRGYTETWFHFKSLVQYKGYNEHWEHMYNSGVILKSDLTCKIQGLYWTLRILVLYILGCREHC